MRKFIYIISFLVFTVSMAHAQDLLKAKLEFEEAEVAYAANKYQLALEKLTTVEGLVGKWAPNIAYLRIQVLDKVCDYEDLNSPNKVPLAKEIKSYLAFANANQSTIVFDKYKEVIQVEKRLNYASEREKWKQMEEYVLAKDALSKKENAVAMDYFSKAAAKNNPVAMFEIALKHYIGLAGLPKNQAEALAWFMKAAELNHIESITYVGDMYSSGKGVDKNGSEAIRWYQKAIDNGGTRAFSCMGGIYLFGEKNVPENPLEALSWYKKGVEKGHVGCIAQIATMYENGMGVPKSYTEAFSWYAKAAEMGDYSSMRKMSELYENGLGVEKNPELALKWKNKAAEWYNK
jgi:TPR repeat protein